MLPPPGTPAGRIALRRLILQTGRLASAAALFVYVADAATQRLTVSQAAFFLMAAYADAAGRPLSRSQLLDAVGAHLALNVRDSYRQLLTPSQNFPDALGWLCAVDSPHDLRERSLKLTARGAAVAHGALAAFAPAGAH